MNLNPKDSYKMFNLCSCGWHYKGGECPFKEKSKEKEEFKDEQKTKG